LVGKDQPVQIMNFEFATATRIIFGAGKRTEAFPITRALGRRALIVTGRDPARAHWLRSGLEAAGVSILFFSAEGEPTINDAERGAAIARENKAEVIVAVGGGSALDCGKAIAALATNASPILDYLEVIGAAHPLEVAPLPVVAIPTTAGTGAEVTRNAVLSSPEHKVKVSLRSPKMLPTAAIIDPELTYHLPPALTASTGLDTLTQLIEPFLCSRANPLTDALCREALPRVAKSLPVAFRTGDNKNARDDMALGSLFGGLALANAGLGAVHGFAAPIGGMFPTPHGSVCAALLPHALQTNLHALRQRAANSPSLNRFDELGPLLTGNPTANANDAITWVSDLCEELKVPKLTGYGIRPEHFDLLCDRAVASSSMKANPIQLTPAELREILERAS
jgi:alcohol dehydrogenase class IV